MELVETIVQTQQLIRAVRSRGKSIGLVPTMGALHEGHRSLVRQARQQCDTVAVSIFVNPDQFGPSEDYKAYPRTLEADLAACREDGVDLVFHPGVEQMYPQQRLTTVRVERLTASLCGAFRPVHFDGVTTVVAKLFNIVQPDYAFFGEKDYQQLVVIRRMARDLDMPIEIIGCPTVREPDGLALSSRNVYLDPAQRQQAASLNRALRRGGEQIAAGTIDAAQLVAEMRAEIEEAGPCGIEYIEIVDPQTLEPLAVVDRPGRICLAVRVGGCRLIDNWPVDGSAFGR